MYLFNVRLLWFVFFISACIFANEKIDRLIPEKVFVSAGNIYCILKNNQSMQITNSGKDYFPILSPDKKIIAFIRKSQISIPKQCSDFANLSDENVAQIWLYDFSTNKTRLLVTNNFVCGELEKQIIDPDNLQFSSNSKTLYFVTSAWVTSGALHAINIDGTKLRYVVPANDYKVIHNGKYKDHLAVSQHRYRLSGGSYDWYWLFTPNGMEEKLLGSEVSNFEK